MENLQEFHRQICYGKKLHSEIPSPSLAQGAKRKQRHSFKQTSSLKNVPAGTKPTAVAVQPVQLHGTNPMAEAPTTDSWNKWVEAHGHMFRIFFTPTESLAQVRVVASIRSAAWWTFSSTSERGSKGNKRGKFQEESKKKAKKITKMRAHLARRA